MTENKQQLKVSSPLSEIFANLGVLLTKLWESRLSDPEDGSESSQNESRSLSENDECHDLSDFSPAQAAGCQPDPECLENYDQWEFVVSRVAVEAMNGRMMV